MEMSDQGSEADELDHVEQGRGAKNPDLPPSAFNV
jgi:hypothetical protein